MTPLPLGPGHPLPPLDTPVLIYSPRSRRWWDGEVSAVAEWDRSPDRWPYSVYVRGDMTTDDYSHWMPLPPPPGSLQVQDAPQK